MTGCERSGTGGTGARLQFSRLEPKGRSPAFSRRRALTGAALLLVERHRWFSLVWGDWLVYGAYLS
jgi:hypothetical protein